MWLRDTGVLVLMKNKVLKPAIPIPLPKQWKDKPLNLNQLRILMIVLSVGIISSVTVFLHELRKTNANKGGSNQSKSSIPRKDRWRIEMMIMEDMVEGGGIVEKGMEHIEVVSHFANNLFTSRVNCIYLPFRR